jgi:hypothetical protein
MSKFVNLTAHSIELLNLGITIPHANRPVKVTQNQKLLAIYDGIPVYELEFSDIAGLPDEEEGTLYIVSAPVLNYVIQKLPHRKDFVSPFKAIKDTSGKTVGCQSFRVNG